MKTLNILGLTVLITALLGCSHLFALPQDGEAEPASGTANIVVDPTDSNILNITVSNNAVVNFSSFNIAENETVNVMKCNITDVMVYNVLFRDMGSSVSIISGNLNALGINLFLTNTNGIYFTPTANVSVNSLVASTLDISSNNFRNGNYLFEHNSDPTFNPKFSSILNEGRITGNNIALIGSAVHNAGGINADEIIVANARTVNLASGDVVTCTYTNTFTAPAPPPPSGGGGNNNGGGSLPKEGSRRQAQDGRSHE